MALASARTPPAPPTSEPEPPPARRGLAAEPGVPPRYPKPNKRKTPGCGSGGRFLFEARRPLRRPENVTLRPSHAPEPAVAGVDEPPASFSLASGFVAGCLTIGGNGRR